MASSLTLPTFEYFEPKTLEETVAFLTSRVRETSLMAGGTDLLVLMKKGVLKPKYVVNISKLPGLSGIKQDEEGLTIGALTTIRKIENSEIVKTCFHFLSEAAGSLGSVQIRNLATIGGNLCRASPSAEMAPPLLATDAKVRTVSPRGSRLLSLGRFFLGPGATALETDEILMEIKVPKLARHTGTAFLKIARTSMDLAKVNVATCVTVEKNICSDVKIALGAVAPTPIRAKKAEYVLQGQELNDVLIEKAAEVAAGETNPINDIRSNAWYRKKVSKTLVSRALKEACERVA